MSTAERAHRQYQPWLHQPTSTTPYSKAILAHTGAGCVSYTAQDCGNTPPSGWPSPSSLIKVTHTNHSIRWGWEMSPPSRGIKQVLLSTTDHISDTDPHLWAMHSPPKRLSLSRVTWRTLLRPLLVWRDQAALAAAVMQQ